MFSKVIFSIYKKKKKLKIGKSWLIVRTVINGFCVGVVCEESKASMKELKAPIDWLVM